MLGTTSQGQFQIGEQDEAGMELGMEVGIVSDLSHPQHHLYLYKNYPGNLDHCYHHSHLRFPSMVPYSTF